STPSSRRSTGGTRSRSTATRPRGTRRRRAASGPPSSSFVGWAGGEAIIGNGCRSTRRRREGRMVLARRPRALHEEVGYHDLLADLRKPGCPACHGGHRAAWRFLDALLWEFVNDPDVRARLRSA